MVNSVRFPKPLYDLWESPLPSPSRLQGGEDGRVRAHMMECWNPNVFPFLRMRRRGGGALRRLAMANTHDSSTSTGLGTIFYHLFF